jgi:hypothetical protein
MPTEMLSYNQLGERLGCSPEGARALVKRLRLPRQKANDGKVLVSIDLTEINHKPNARPVNGQSPSDHRLAQSAHRGARSRGGEQDGPHRSFIARGLGSASNWLGVLQGRSRFRRLLSPSICTSIAEGRSSRTSPALVKLREDQALTRPANSFDGNGRIDKNRIIKPLIWF